MKAVVGTPSRTGHDATVRRLPGTVISYVSFMALGAPDPSEPFEVV
jgi:hypothetical protein